MMCKTYFHFSRNQDVITGILNFTLRILGAIVAPNSHTLGDKTTKRVKPTKMDIAFSEKMGYRKRDAIL